MLVSNKKIRMAAIDFDSLVESEISHESVEFDILLSDTPSGKWIDEFEVAYRTRPFDIKPPASIHGDRMRISYLPRYDDELQEYVDFLKDVMEVADVEVEKTIAISGRGDKHAHIAEFHDDLRKVHIGKG